MNFVSNKKYNIHPKLAKADTCSSSKMTSNSSNHSGLSIASHGTLSALNLYTNKIPMKLTANNTSLSTSGYSNDYGKSSSGYSSDAGCGRTTYSPVPSSSSSQSHSEHYNNTSNYSAGTRLFLPSSANTCKYSSNLISSNYPHSYTDSTKTSPSLSSSSSPSTTSTSSHQILFTITSRIPTINSFSGGNSNCYSLSRSKGETNKHNLSISKCPSSTYKRKYILNRSPVGNNCKTTPNTNTCNSDTSNCVSSCELKTPSNSSPNSMLINNETLHDHIKALLNDDKDLVHEFVKNDGLSCLIKVGSEADQNYQNYILRALGQVMHYVEGMTAIIEHNQVIQWLYTLSCHHRLVVKTALKLLYTFAEYAETNCVLLVRAIETVDRERGTKPWSNIMNIMNEKDSADVELLIFSMTLINKTLKGIPDQDTYYDVVDMLEEQGMERIIQNYMSKRGTDHDLLQQFRNYEMLLRFEDGDVQTLTDDSQSIVSHERKQSSLSNGQEESERRRSRRHCLVTSGTREQGIKQSLKNNYEENSSSENLQENCFEEENLEHINNLNNNQNQHNNMNNNNNKYVVNSVVSTCDSNNIYDDITPALRKRRERDARQKFLIKEQESLHQRSSISSSSSSADSYASYESYLSYESIEEKSPLIETIKILPPAMVEKAKFTNFENTCASKTTKREIESTKNNQENMQTNQRDVNWKEEEEENNNNLKKNMINLNGNLNGNLNLNGNGDVCNNENIHHLLDNEDMQLNDKKGWMLSMMFGGNQSNDQSNSVNTNGDVNVKCDLKKSFQGTDWTQTDREIQTIYESTTNLRHLKQQEKSINEKYQEKLLQAIEANADAIEPIVRENCQRSIATKDLTFNEKSTLPNDPKNNCDYLRWEDLKITSLSRPLVINDLDFSELREDDDIDISVVNTESAGSTPPPPPPPPPPPMFSDAHSILMSPLLGIPPLPPLRISSYLQMPDHNIQNSPSPTPSETLSQSSKIIPKNKKTVKLFWREVKEDRSLLSRITKKKTIWDSIKQINVDTNQLEQLFENRAKELVNKKSQESGKKNEIRVLDTKRSNAINIGMTKLPPPRAIKAAILKMDSTIMNKEGIEKILTTMMPTEEEKTKIMESYLANPDIPLGSAESFLLTLASISCLEARLRLWAFRLDYSVLEREVAEPLMDLKQAMAELEKSETFKNVLGTLLSIGNFLNGIDAKGFQIDYLSKVPEIKDTNQKHTLLYHLCHIVIEKFPKTTDLYSEFGAVSRASKVDFDEVSQNLKKMEQDCKSSWEHLKMIVEHDGAAQMKQKISEFLADCAQRITVLAVIHRRVLNRFKKLLVYLGFPSHSINEIKPHQILKVVSEFSLEYRTTSEKVKEQLEKKERLNRLKNNRMSLDMSSSSMSREGKIRQNGFQRNKFRSEEQETDQELKQLLSNGNLDYESDNGRIPSKWGTLPGAKLRRPSHGSMNNLLSNGGSLGRPVSHRHSMDIDKYTDEDNEILESLVKTASAQPVKGEQSRIRRKSRIVDKKSLRRTLKNGLDLSEEERLTMAYTCD